MRLATWSTSSSSERIKQKPQVVTLAAFLLRATSGTRTLDPSFTKAVLYQLS